MKRLLINLLKIGGSVTILALLFMGTRDSLYELRDQPKNWGLLSMATAVALVAVCLSFFRWYILVRALGLPFRLRDAYRLSFVGYLFNFVSLGAVGGDLFKAVFIAREQPGRRAEAVATVFFDRLIGLYTLFLLATIAVMWMGLLSSPVPEIRVICQITVAGTVAGTVGVLLLLTPGCAGGRVARSLTRIPKVGPIAHRLLVAVQIYSRKKSILLAALAISLVVHLLFTGCFYLIALGLPGNAPTLADHVLIVPLGMVAGVTPLPLSGLGATEAVVEFLYVRLPGTLPVAKGAGLIVCLTYRAITMLVAIIGVIYYAANRALMAQAMREAARQQEQADEADSALEDTLLPEELSGDDLSGGACSNSQVTLLKR